ncbi:TQO small subunit DoxA domain-containing protein [Vulcanisaeta distributa]|uniref:TQO small subunit DoxA domain-containing protein n=1 Tax=Vulcanisaeta distributa TaxID=164451 RepID=UPI0006D19EC3|nr:TQO small subunit DoxA domain-containing protein [Vulcanisaeta distributa]
MMYNSEITIRFSNAISNVGAAYSLAGTRLLDNGTLISCIIKVAGLDTYGEFVVLVQALYLNGTIAYEWNSTYLGHIPQYDIVNKYDLPGHLVRSDGFALVVPLGQSAIIKLYAPITFSRGTYIIRVYDVDRQYETYGIKFQVYVTVNG